MAFVQHTHFRIPKWHCLTILYSVLVSNTSRMIHKMMDNDVLEFHAEYELNPSSRFRDTAVEAPSIDSIFHVQSGIRTPHLLAEIQ